MTGCSSLLAASTDVQPRKREKMSSSTATSTCTIVLQLQQKGSCCECTHITPHIHTRMRSSVNACTRRSHVCTNMRAHTHKHAQIMRDICTNLDMSACKRVDTYHHTHIHAQRSVQIQEAMPSAQVNISKKAVFRVPSPEIKMNPFI